MASVIEIESESISSISTTLATQSRHVHDHMETRLYTSFQIYIVLIASNDPLENYIPFLDQQKSVSACAHMYGRAAHCKLYLLMIAKFC